MSSLARVSARCFSRPDGHRNHIGIEIIKAVYEMQDLIVQLDVVPLTLRTFVDQT